MNLAPGLRRWTALVILAIGFHAGSAAAEPVLTVGGTDFAPAQFQALPRASLSTVTPFMDGVQHFEGVWLTDLLAVAGVPQGRDIAAAALDEYTVTIPADDIAGVRIIVADRQNGAPLDPDGMGPYWIIYPADSGVEKAQDRMIWQLRSLTPG